MLKILYYKELLEKSDVVFLHLHANEETRNMDDREFLSSMKKGAILINTSRGELVDEESLLNGLISGDIGGAGLDVLSGEPDVKKNKLFKFRNSDLNLVITPHIGGFSYDALVEVLKFCCDRIKLFESENKY